MIPFFTTRPVTPDAAVAGGAKLRSAASPWVRVTWQTASVPELVETSPDIIRPATRNESQKVLEVILNSLSMDSEWNDLFAKVEQYLKDAVTRLFSKEEPSCLVIPKGNRFIAASLLDPTTGGSNQLLSGPVVLTEYRNRGMGSRLLHASLVALRDRDLATVSGITRANTTSATYVYTKFAGIKESVQFPSSVESVEEIKN
jgi:predicted N-acetyltransferase YhbS